MEKYSVLKKYFGYEGFREGQENLIDAILKGSDVLGIMPTGAGKSICYQVPALLLEGVTIVISPLISLMIDQVKALNQAGIHAAYINSSLSEAQIAKALQYAAEYRYKIIYVAPERLETDNFLYFAMNTKISMVTVDEAHCISQWGQDFRPSYLKIVNFINSLPVRPVVSAFTATATERVKDDIVCILNLQNPVVKVTGFDRGNLYFEVRHSKKKDSQLLQYVKEHSNESGIIYCATRKNVDTVCEMLQANGISATKYHAGLSAEERNSNQEDFIYDKNPVMVATNAFGMGIDKSNVRYVIHYNMPQSMENYYQEAGRAGRDGEPSSCILLYSPQDVMINQFLIENKGDNQEFTSEEMMQIRENDEKRLRAMTAYCTTKRCLRTFILQYFGERPEELGRGNCGNCSNCLTEYVEEDVTETAKAIINCIRECGQRYGINVIVGVLRGENRAKLRSYGLTDMESFGLCKGEKEEKLKDIIQDMLQNEYLWATEDKYRILRVTTKCKAVLEDQERVVMQCIETKEEEVEVVAPAKSKQRMSDILTSNGFELFEALRTLRYEIAREEAMPPYIIFSDKTLVDMCVKVPKDRQDMLQVSGVGENKYERYGERFLACIADFTSRVQGPYCFEGSEEEIISAPVRKRSGRKEAFVLTKEMAENVVYTEEGPLGELVDQLNTMRDINGMKRLTQKVILEQMKAEGYFEEEYVNGRSRKHVLASGEELGIREEERVGKSGIPYTVLMFSEAAQRMVVERLQSDWKEIT